MKICIDKTLPLALELFSKKPFELSFFHRDQCLTSPVDIVICRAHTKVNNKFLNGYTPRLIGTATSGTDHIDIDLLNHKGIEFLSAQGCNAQSVAEYVLHLLFHPKFPKDINKIGIIGLGNVGQLLSNWLIKLGYQVIPYDPPRAHRDKNFTSAKLEALFDCELISIHVPLVINGDYPTASMIDNSFLSALKQSTTIINTSRGQAISEQALIENNQHQYCLDVYSNEPDINPLVIKHCLFATPHIAGHALEAKHRAVYSLYKQIAERLNIKKFDNKYERLLTTPTFKKTNDINFKYDPYLDTIKLKKNPNPKEFLLLRRQHTLRHEIFSTSL